jgi:hypothetical protein
LMTMEKLTRFEGRHASTLAAECQFLFGPGHQVSFSFVLRY